MFFKTMYCELFKRDFQFSSFQFSRSVVSDSLWPHESQHARPPCPSPTPGVYPNSCPSSWWCHPAISSSAVPFSSCQSFLKINHSSHCLLWHSIWRKFYLWLKIFMIKKKMFIINKKIILKNLFLVADKILKMKDYPLYINQNCHRVTVSPYTETHLKKFQVKSSFFFHFGS